MFLLLLAFRLPFVGRFKTLVLCLSAGKLTGKPGSVATWPRLPAYRKKNQIQIVSPFGLDYISAGRIATALRTPNRRKGIGNPRRKTVPAPAIKRKATTFLNYGVERADQIQGLEVLG